MLRMLRSALFCSFSYFATWIPNFFISNLVASACLSSAAFSSVKALSSVEHFLISPSVAFMMALASSKRPVTSFNSISRLASLELAANKAFSVAAAVTLDAASSFRRSSSSNDKVWHLDEASRAFFDAFATLSFPILMRASISLNLFSLVLVSSASRSFRSWYNDHLHSFSMRMFFISSSASSTSLAIATAFSQSIPYVV
mmetsp:Transcript_683/g.992  ORF Transcript_683/g.992 Transcript_683/m.992 type:complete len:200 (-) Transcript_683:1175-1774(-)